MSEPGCKTPAVFANIFDVRIHADGVARVVFSDAIVGTEKNERAHVAMTADNLRQLGELISRLIKTHNDKSL